MVTSFRAGGPLDPNEPSHVAQESASHALSNWVATIVSLIALAFSGWSLWETSLKKAHIVAAVPAVIHFSAPYQNTNFEVVQVPVTLTNDGARTATVLGLELAVVDPSKKSRKVFYAGDFGRWTMDGARAGTFRPFAPISVQGNESRSETILFYTRGADQKPDEIFRETGPYKFELSMTLAETGDGGFIDRLTVADTPATLTFSRALKEYDARAFTNGVLELVAPDWKAARSAS